MSQAVATPASQTVAVATLANENSSGSKQTAGDPTKNTIHLASKQTVGVA